MGQCVPGSGGMRSQLANHMSSMIPMWCGVFSSCRFPPAPERQKRTTWISTARIRKPLAMPTDKGLRSDNRQGLSSIELLSEPVQGKTDGMRGTSRLDPAILIEGELLAKNKGFGSESGTWSQTETKIAQGIGGIASSRVNLYFCCVRGNPGLTTLLDEALHVRRPQVLHTHLLSDEVARTAPRASDRLVDVLHHQFE